MTKEQIEALNKLIGTCISCAVDPNCFYIDDSKGECLESLKNFLDTMGVAFYTVKTNEDNWPYVEEA